MTHDETSNTMTRDINILIFYAMVRYRVRGAGNKISGAHSCSTIPLVPLRNISRVRSKYVACLHPTGVCSWMSESERRCRLMCRWRQLIIIFQIGALSFRAVSQSVTLNIMFMERCTGNSFHFIFISFIYLIPAYKNILL